MSEGGGSPEEIKPGLELKSGVQVDEFGDIEGGNQQEDAGGQEPFVDPDDLPENQGLRPRQSLDALRARLDSANQSYSDQTVRLPKA